MTVRRETLKAAVFVFVPLVLFYHAVNSLANFGHTARLHHERMQSWCPIPESMPGQDPANDLRPSSDFAKDEAVEIQVQRLAAAVRVATESWDDNGDVDVDPRWEVFDEFHRVLRVHFPRVYGMGFRILWFSLISSRPLAMRLPRFRSHIVMALSIP